MALPNVKPGSSLRDTNQRDMVLAGQDTIFEPPEKSYRLRFLTKPDIQSETGKLLTTKDLSNLKMKIMKGWEKQSEESKEINMDLSHQGGGIQGSWLNATW